MPSSAQSCNQCRERRIACVWPHATSQQKGAPKRLRCSACAKRNTRCDGPPPPHPPGFKWRRVAKGTRIEEVRRALAAGELLGARSPSDSPSPPRNSQSDATPRLSISPGLYYHLVHAASSVGNDVKPGTGLAIVSFQLQESGLAPRRAVNATSGQLSGFVGLQDCEELMMTCFAAVGARVSQHTALTDGPIICLTDDTVPGHARDGFCNALIDRAVKLADESGLFNLDHATFETTQAVNFLRHTINVVAPNHSSSATIIYALHQLHMATGVGSSCHPLKRWKYPMFDIVLADAQLALRLHTTCIVSDEDIARRYSWTSPRWLEAVAQLTELTTRPWREEYCTSDFFYSLVKHVLVFLSRSLVTLRSQGRHETSYFLSTSFHRLADIWEQVDTVHALYRRRAEQNHLEPFEWWGDLIEGTHRQGLSFAASACEALEFLRGTNWAGDAHEEVVRRWRGLFLSALKRMIGTAAFTSAGAYTPQCDTAAFFASLDRDFDWPRLAVDAAQSDSVHLNIGLTYSDLCRLRTALGVFGTIHGAVEQQHHRMDACMKAVDWYGVESPASDSRSSPSELGFWDFFGDSADHKVHSELRL